MSRIYLSYSFLQAFCYELEIIFLYFYIQPYIEFAFCVCVNVIFQQNVESNGANWFINGYRFISSIQSEE
jgi:hypothetical protein